MQKHFAVLTGIVMIGVAGIVVSQQFGIFSDSDSLRGDITTSVSSLAAFSCVNGICSPTANGAYADPSCGGNCWSPPSSYPSTYCCFDDRCDTCGANGAYTEQTCGGTCRPANLGWKIEGCDCVDAVGGPYFEEEYCTVNIPADCSGSSSSSEDSSSLASSLCNDYGEYCGDGSGCCTGFECCTGPECLEYSDKCTAPSSSSSTPPCGLVGESCCVNEDPGEPDYCYGTLHCDLFNICTYVAPSSSMSSTVSSPTSSSAPSPSPWYYFGF